MARLHSIVFFASCVFALSLASNVVPRQAGTPRPALSVGLTYNMSFPQPTNVLYDRVFLDTTNSYDASSGSYVIPMTGDYVVMLHALAEYDGTLWLDLYRNDDYILSAYAHTTAQYGAASNTGVARYNQGDRLHVQGRGSSILFGYDDDVYCTLNVFLLHDRSGQQ